MISREHAKEVLENLVNNEVLKSVLLRTDIEAMKCAISALSENRGEWIVQPSNKEQGERDFIWWKCSKCGQEIFSETERDRREYHKFCSRCGADMRGGT